jgi:hypothetical protein
MVKLPGSDPHGLSGVYALNAVTGAELDSFERHLDSCQICIQEVRGLHATVSELALAVAAPPPAQLRARVLALVPSVEQLPTRSEPAAQPVPRESARHSAKPRPAHKLQRRGRAGWMPRLVVGIAAVTTAAAVVLGFMLASVESQLSAMKASQQATASDQRALVQMLDAPGARIRAGHTSVGGRASVLLVPGDTNIIVITKGLPALSDGKVYQAWLIGAKSVGTRSAGLLAREPPGGTATLLASGLTRGDQFAITVEPAGGTPQPTTTPIVDIPLPR